ncbi:MAG: thermostable hemolysin [Neisseria sp.]|uniref:thermostable hemolysin n=1 Tax=Neisseria sp. TaxID=192066 RepID=UPI0026DB8FA2|nr:thermostable hemolysin [Neisseria sp.]MDO4641050.1 thermostable hemolysin [Neisseria sp.]
MISFLYKNSNKGSPLAQIDIIFNHEELAEDVRKYIIDIYKKNYDATIYPNPDVFIAYKDRITGDLLACTGISFRHSLKQLFSESYLNAPLSEVILKKTNCMIDEENIIEVGSLASNNPSAVGNMLHILPFLLWFMGYEAVIFTATSRLSKILAFYRIPFSILATASIECIPEEERKLWGSYYDQSPKTVVVLLEQCVELFGRIRSNLTFIDFEGIHRNFLN